MPTATVRRHRTAARALRALPLAALLVGGAFPRPHGAGPRPGGHPRLPRRRVPGRRAGGPSLVALGGTVGPTSYTFGAGQGLTLANALNPRVYSLELMFSFQTVSGQRQVVDLTDVQDSRGLRISDGRVNLNGTDVNAPVVFQANRPAHFVITRDANDSLHGLRGRRGRAVVPRQRRARVFSAPGQLAALFTNNPVWGPSSAGELFWARTYDVALTREQVLARGQAGDDALPATRPRRAARCPSRAPGRCSGRGCSRWPAPRGAGTRRPENDRGRDAGAGGASRRAPRTPFA
jgi:hypothetical protein